MAQDDYYYEIQLTNKQLIFYFMAGAAGLILSFLAGVMVGRGVDGAANAAGAEPTRVVSEEKVVAEPTPAATPTEFSYPQRLESDRPSETLEKEKPPSARAGSEPTPAPATATAAPRAAAPTPRPTPTPARTAAATQPAQAVAAPAQPSHPPTAAPAGGGLPKPIGSSPSVKGFAVQVGAFKDHASAEAIVKSLRGRGFPAFSAPAAGGLFPVRVGVYRDRTDAEAVQERLRDDKFKPYIFKQ